MKHTFVDSALQQRMTLDVTQKLVFPGGTSSIELTCQCRRYRRHRRCWFDSWVGKILWREARQPTLVFLPGESHGLRNLESYHHKELDVIEATQHACTTHKTKCKHILNFCTTQQNFKMGMCYLLMWLTFLWLGKVQKNLLTSIGFKRARLG